MVVAGGRTWEEAIAVGNIAVAGVVRGIRGLGLGVAPRPSPRKTEAVFFHYGAQGPPPNLALLVDGQEGVSVWIVGGPSRSTSPSWPLG